jgi:hypothetical protein
MPTAKDSKGGDLSALLRGGQESPVPNPDIPIMVVRVVAALILTLWYGGQAAQAQLLAWADQALLAYTKQTDGTWVANRPVLLGGDLIRWFLSADVQHVLTWAILIILSALLLELLGLLLQLQRHLHAPLRTTTAAYRIRTLSPVNRVNFPTTLDAGSLWAALIGAADRKAGQGICLTLHRTENSAATFGVQVRTHHAPPARARPAAPAPPAPAHPLVRARPTGPQRSDTRGSIRPTGHDQIAPPALVGAAARCAEQARTVASTLSQYDETAQLDAVPDPLRAVLQPGMIVVSQEYRLRRAPHWPLKAADMMNDTLRALASGLIAQRPILFHEMQLALTPLPASDTRRWYQRGRWYHRRLKRYTAIQIQDDFQALNTKLADRHVALTIRFVVVLAAGTDPAVGTQALAASGTALHTLDARYRIPPIGTAKQALMPIGAPQVLTVTAAALATPITAPRPLALAAMISATLVVLALLALVYGYTTNQWAQWADLAPALQRGLLALAGLHAVLAITSDGWAACRLPLARILHRQPRPLPADEPLLLPMALLTPPPILSSSEAGQLWHLPDKQAVATFTWLTNRQVAAPPSMFVPKDATDWLTLGMARTRSGDLAPVGLPLTALHQMMHITAGMGAGKSQAAASMCAQLLPHGFIIIDGKGDDEGGGLGAIVRRYPSLALEHRIRYIDLLDTAFPVSINPIYHRMVALAQATSKEAADMHFNAALGILMGLFQRLDPDTWEKAPGMKQYALMGCTLVLRTGSDQPGDIPTLAKVGRALRDVGYRAMLLERYATMVGVTDLVYEFWTVREPATADTLKTSLSALLRRFDQLLLNPITRSLISIEMPSVDLLAAMEEGQLVIIPIPHRTLGGLAPLVTMLVTQAVIAAAYLRPGNAQSRTTAPVFIDEVQVLIMDGKSEDLVQAFSQLRGFAVPLIVLHQTLSQLGELDEIIRINAANRLILRTGEPDAGTYAKMYSNFQLRPEDILGMPALDQQYAVTLGPDRSVQLASIVPNPWPKLPEVITAMHLVGTHWSMESPHNRTESTLDERDAWWTIDRALTDLLYNPWSQADYTRIVGQLIQLPDAEWVILLSRSAILRAHHRQYILDHPGCISDQIQRQTWLTRLIASRGGLIEEAIFLREERRFSGSTAIQTIPPRRDTLVPTGGTHGASAGPSAPLGVKKNLAPGDQELDQRTETGKPYDHGPQPDNIPTVGTAQ